ncbi:MAG: CvpA family protein [Alphaproteobacteria bacterium]|nr:MAG: CvpA family protein [Alphaproteobacteria bacterium]
MEGFTIVDGVVALVIVVSAILAYVRGLSREVMAILGWVAAAVVGYYFAPQLEPLVSSAPVVGDLLRGSCELGVLTAFAAVMAVALVVLSIFTPLLSSLVQYSVLGGIDQALGFVFGALRGIVLVAIAFLVIDKVVASESVPQIAESRSAAIFSDLQSRIEASMPDDASNWIASRYETLVAKCSGPAQ